MNSFRNRNMIKVSTLSWVRWDWLRCTMKVPAQSETWSLFSTWYITIGKQVDDFTVIHYFMLMCLIQVVVNDDDILAKNWADELAWCVSWRRGIKNHLVRRTRWTTSIYPIKTWEGSSAGLFHRITRGFIFAFIPLGKPWKPSCRNHYLFKTVLFLIRVDMIDYMKNIMLQNPIRAPW